MAITLLMAVLLGLGLEVHPGDSVRRASRGIRDGGVPEGLRTRLGGLVAVAAAAALLQGIALLLPRALDDPALRFGASLLTASALLCAGWHRIATTSRLDLRRSRLLDDDGTGTGFVEGFLGELRRPGWHLFWWAAAPGLVLLAVRASSAGVPLAWTAFAVAIVAWLLLLSVRMRHDREKVMATPTFRTLHSLGGLGLVALAGLFLAEALDASGMHAVVTEGVLRPLLGGGS